MADISEIRARISSIADTKKVTDAMYMISSVKMRHAKSEVEKTSPYFKALKEEINKLFLHIPQTQNRYFTVEKPENTEHLRHGILVVTSDKGLAGAYNQTVLKVCESYMARHPKTVLFVIGEYGRRYLSNKKIPFVSDFCYSADFPAIWKARRICADLLEYYDKNELDEINIIYTDYISGKQSQCKRNVLLPLDRSRFASPKSEINTNTDEFYPSPDEVLNRIVPGFLTGFIYSCLVDSFCSEQESRMTAMSKSSKNAGEMLENLKRQYNSLRQSAITEEMIETASSSGALKMKKEQTRQIYGK